MAEVVGRGEEEEEDEEEEEGTAVVILTVVVAAVVVGDTAAFILSFSHFTRWISHTLTLSYNYSAHRGREEGPARKNYTKD